MSAESAVSWSREWALCGMRDKRPGGVGMKPEIRSSGAPPEPHLGPERASPCPRRHRFPRWQLSTCGRGTVGARYPVDPAVKVGGISWRFGPELHYTQCTAASKLRLRVPIPVAGVGRPENILMGVASHNNLCYPIIAARVRALRRSSLPL